MSDTDIDRFFKKVRKTRRCWIWKGAGASAGYGLFVYRGKRGYAHRFGYEISNGPIPPGLTIDHLCRNKLCVNPKHLEAVSRAENSSRAPRAGLLIVVFSCPSCDVRFEVRKGNSHLVKGGTFTCCSRRCRGLLSRRIQLNGLTDDISRKIRESAITEYRRAPVP